MIKAILTLTSLNLVLLPLTFLVHVDALDMGNCSVTAYASSPSVLAKFTECTAPKARVVFYNMPAAAGMSGVETDLQSSLAFNRRVTRAD